MVSFDKVSILKKYANHTIFETKKTIFEGIENLRKMASAIVFGNLCRPVFPSQFTFCAT